MILTASQGCLWDHTFNLVWTRKAVWEGTVSSHQPKACRSQHNKLSFQKWLHPNSFPCLEWEMVTLQWNVWFQFMRVGVLLHHGVQFIMQVSLGINVFIWTSDKKVLILLNHTLNTRNPLWNIKCPSELLIFALGQKQLGSDIRPKCLTQSNTNSGADLHGLNWSFSRFLKWNP